MRAGKGYSSLLIVSKGKSVMFSKLFLDHPRSVEESYGEHFGMALRFAGLLVLAAGACLLHAIIPGLCRTTGSDIIRKLHDEMVVNRHRRPAQTSGGQREAA